MNPKYSFHLLVCTALFAVSVGVGGCQMHDSGVTVDTLIADAGPTTESWDPVMHISENGLPRLVLRAGYMARYETPDSTYLVLSAVEDGKDRVRVDIFDTEGDSSATVFSNRILYFERARRFVARGNVIVNAKDDRHLFAEHLDWSQKTARVSTPGYVTLKTPTQVLNGFEFDADEQLYDFRMKRVSGTLESENE